METVLSLVLWNRGKQNEWCPRPVTAWQAWCGVNQSSADPMDARKKRVFVGIQVQGYTSAISRNACWQTTCSLFQPSKKNHYYRTSNCQWVKAIIPKENFYSFLWCQVKKSKAKLKKENSISQTGIRIVFLILWYLIIESHIFKIKQNTKHTFWPLKKNHEYEDNNEVSFFF